jgi:TonB family protein
MVKTMKGVLILGLLLILLAGQGLAQTPGAEEHLKLGKDYLEAKKYKQAIEEFRRASRLRPDSSEAFYQLGLAHRDAIAVSDKAGRTDEAARAFKEATRLKPDFAEAHHQLGWSYYDLGQPDQAVESLKEALRLKPDLAEAHWALGTVYLKKGQYAEAVKPLEEAVRIKPEYAMAHQNLGLAYLTVDQREKAQEQYNILKSLDEKKAAYLLDRIESPEKPTFGIVQGKALSIPAPEFPAGMSQWSGVITVEVQIDEKGNVTSARAKNGPSDFQRISEAAAMKARFVPTKLSGAPVKVKGVLTYNFVRR